MAIPVKRWQKDSLSPPSSSLACAFSPLAFSGRFMHWECDFFPRLFSFRVWECLISWWTRGKKGQKRQKESKQKSNKGPIWHVGRSQTVTGQFTYTHTHGHSLINLMKHTGWMGLCGIQEGNSVSPRTLKPRTNQGFTEILYVHMQHQICFNLFSFI